MFWPVADFLASSFIRFSRHSTCQPLTYKPKHALQCPSCPSRRAVRKTRNMGLVATEGVTMLRKMIAEVSIEDPTNLTGVCAALIEHGLDVELGDCGDKDLDVIVQLDARTLSELDDGDFRNWVTGIVKQV